MEVKSDKGKEMARMSMASSFDLGDKDMLKIAARFSVIEKQTI